MTAQENRCRDAGVLGWIEEGINAVSFSSVVISFALYFFVDGSQVFVSVLESQVEGQVIVMNCDEGEEVRARACFNQYSI